MNNQTIEVGISPDSRVTLFKNVDIDGSEGSSGTILFEGYVDRYVPQTGLLEFEESDVGRTEFQRLLDEADAIEVIQSYEHLSATD
jgi:hypothetical protein